MELGEDLQRHMKGKVKIEVSEMRDGLSTGVHGTTTAELLRVHLILNFDHSALWSVAPYPCSVQSLDQFDCRGKVTDDSTEIIFQFFLIYKQFWHGQG